MKITINQNESQLIKLNNSNLQDINIQENIQQEITLRNNTPQDIDINQNENQVILINGGGAIIGITDVLVNGVSVVSGNIAYIIIPTKLSQLQNDSHFITSETDPTVASYIKAITLSDINSWNNKQAELVSGTNIKTINGNSILGDGNLVISGTQYSAGDGISIENDTITNTVTSYNALSDLPTIPTKTSDLLNDNDFVEEGELAEVAFTGSYANLDNTPNIPIYTSDLTNDSGFIDNTVNNLTNYMLTTDINTALGNKQDTLVSGTNIKTINSTSLLGSGDITITQPTKTSDLTNDSGFITNTDFATTSTGGVVKVNGFGLAMATNGTLRGSTYTYANYTTTNNTSLITKGTLENVITGKGLIDNIIKINMCSDSVTVLANSIDSYTLRTLPIITGYTFVGILPYNNGYSDQWLVSYGYYNGNIVAMINSKFAYDLTSTLNYSLIYLKDDYYNSNVTQL